MGRKGEAMIRASGGAGRNLLLWLAAVLAPVMLDCSSAGNINNKKKTPGAPPLTPIEKCTVGDKCGSGSDGPSPRLVTLPPIQSAGSVVLRALKVYPTGEASDGEAQLSSSIPFTVPAALPARLGTAGLGRVELSFRASSGAETRCEYRGAGLTEKGGAGRSYVFVACDNGQRAGEAASGDWFKLHVAEGNALDPAGLTQVEASLGGALDELEPPISPEETARLRDSFAWALTAPWAERGAEGLPSLYYALVYVESHAQLAALDELAIHYSALPLFDEELERWRGKRGVFGHEGDGHGVFLFALVPGVTFNLLRSLATLGDVIFPALVQREVPAAARAPDGSVSYEALRSSNFAYRGAKPPEEASQAPDAPALDPQREALVSTAQAVAQEAVEGIGSAEPAEHGAVNLYLKLDIRNTDPAFGLGTPMVSTRNGEPIRLNGVRVTLRQRSLGALLISSDSADTQETSLSGVDVSSLATLPLGLGRDFTLCVSTSNHAAHVTRGLLPVEICSFGVEPVSDTSWSVLYTLPIAHPYFNLLAQLSEGRELLTSYADGAAPAEVLVGPIADLAGTAFVPCLAASRSNPNAFVSALAEGLRSQGPVGEASAARVLTSPAAFAVDFIVPSAPAAEGIDAHLDTRGFITREYGHFALCSMLYEQAPGDFATLYGELALGRARSPGDPSPGDGAVYEARYIDEAFANEFSAWLGGGVAYFDPNASSGPFDRFGLHSCEAENGACLDADRKSIETFADQVARATTLLHDAFDGALGQDESSNGNVWSLDPQTGFLVYGREKRVSTTDDEPFNLGPWALFELVGELVTKRNGDPALSQDGLMSALSVVLDKAGHDWCSRCGLFASHDARWSPGQPLPDICSVVPTSTWLGTDVASSLIAVKLGPDDEGTIVRSGVDVSDTSFPDTPFFSAAVLSAPTYDTGIYRGYFAFDLSPLQGRDVLGAELLLFEDHSEVVFGNQSGHMPPGDPPAAAYVRRVLGPWQASTLTWNTQPPAEGEASSGPLADDSGWPYPYRFDVGTMVREMVTQPEANYGFSLQLQDESAPDRALVFYSGKPNDDGSPKLKITVAGCP
jgi:hypothetical protein